MLFVTGCCKRRPARRLDGTRLHRAGCIFLSAGSEKLPDPVTSVYNAGLVSWSACAVTYRPRIKICGLRNVEDACYAASLGVDALGLVFYPPSPRHVSLEQAQAIVAALPPFVSVVALLVNPEREQLETLLASLSVDVLQFHGDEDEVFCRSFARPYVKALAVDGGHDLQARMQSYPSAQGFLLDTSHPDLRGGTGQCFDWSLFPRTSSRPLILAGGLRPDNVAQAIHRLKPYAVDVSGGVESSRGVKSQALMRAFVEGVGCVHKD